MWTVVLAGAGVLLAVWGAVALRTELGAMFRRRRGEIALYTLGMIGVLIALAYHLGALSVPFRSDRGGVVLAVGADGDHAEAAGKAGAHRLFPRPTDAGDGRDSMS